MRYVVHNYFPGYRRRTRDEWQESKHPRVASGPNAGQFGKGSGGSSPEVAKQHGIGPYFAKKFKPSESKTHFEKQFKAVVSLNNQSSHYRNVVKMLLADLEVHNVNYDAGEYAAKRWALENKVIESLALQKSNLRPTRVIPGML